MEERITQQSFSLESHISESRSNACTDYVVSRKLQRLCRSFFEKADSTYIMHAFEIKCVSVYNVKKHTLLEKCLKTLDRANSADLDDLLQMSIEYDLTEFVKKVVKFKLRNINRVKK